MKLRWWGGGQAFVHPDGDLGDGPQMAVAWVGDVPACPHCGGTSPTEPDPAFGVPMCDSMHEIAGEVSYVAFERDPRTGVQGKGVRRAGPSDLLTLRAHVWDAPRFAPFRDPKPSDLEARSPYRYYLGVEEGRSVGFCMWSNLAPARERTLELVLVERAFQRRGWGRRLVLESEGDPQKEPIIGVRTALYEGGAALLTSAGYDLDGLVAVTSQGIF